MKTLVATVSGVVLLVLAVAANGPQTPSPASQGPASMPAAAAGAESDAALVKTYCVGCHNDRAKAGGLTLASFEPGKAAALPDVSEKIVRKLAAGMMPGRCGLESVCEQVTPAPRPPVLESPGDTPYSCPVPDGIALDTQGFGPHRLAA